MIEYFKTILTSQYEASLCMMDHCIRACPDTHWEGKVANRTFRWVAYHTLFWTDMYLSPGDEGAFILRDFHSRGGDERNDHADNPGLDKNETLDYVAICREKVIESVGAETAESLQGPGGFGGRPKTRGELHVYNIRHIQHHAGQLSAHLRRVDPEFSDFRSLPWIGSGWR